MNYFYDVFMNFLKLENVFWKDKKDERISKIS